MGQVRRGKVRVENGSATVRHVWTAIFAVAPPDPFVAGEALSWSGSGVGTALRYDAPGKRLYFVRTSGGLPATGHTIEGGTSGAAATIAEMGEGDPPTFDLLLPDGATRIFTVSGTPTTYQLTGAAGSDFFTLSAPYADDSNDEAPYGVQTGFTAWGAPMIESGDSDAPALVTLGFLAHEARARMWTHAGFASNKAMAPGGLVVVPFDSAVYDPDGWVQGDGGLKVPAGRGIELVEIYVGVILNSATAFNLSLTKNGAAFSGSPFTAGSGAHYFATGPIACEGGDIFRLHITNGVSVTILGGVNTYFKARVLA